MISVKDSINLPEINNLKPEIFVKNNITYYGFNTKQSEYIYNSLLQRDFFYEKYQEKKSDFNKITKLYDKKITTLNKVIVLKDSIITKKDSIILNKDKECKEISNNYEKTIKKMKVKNILNTSIGVFGGIVAGIITILILK